jgi:hypothetical protein
LHAFPRCEPLCFVWFLCNCVRKNTLAASLSDCRISVLKMSLTVGDRLGGWSS